MMSLRPFSNFRNAALLPLLLLLVPSGCQQHAEPAQSRFFMMGTWVEFTVLHPDSTQAEQAIHAAQQAMQTIYHEFKPGGDGELARINRTHDSQAFSVSDPLQYLFTESLRIHRQSLGAFDITLGELNTLWGFSATTSPGTIPNPDTIAKAQQHTDCLQAATKQQWYKTYPACQLDLGAIAKGYAIDRGIHALQAHGIAHAIINAGGDMRIIGNKYGKPWRIGIRHPRKSDDVLHVLELQGDTSVVTSGDYERFIILDGMRYHHILNPRTGYPASHSQSTTVIADSAMFADAWSTALFVLGQQGLSMLEQQGVSALWVDEQGIPHYTTSMQSLLKKQAENLSLQQTM